MQMPDLGEQTGSLIGRQHLSRDRDRRKWRIRWSWSVHWAVNELARRYLCCNLSNGVRCVATTTIVCVCCGPLQSQRAVRSFWDWANLLPLAPSNSRAEQISQICWSALRAKPRFELTAKRIALAADLRNLSEAPASYSRCERTWLALAHTRWLILANKEIRLKSLI